MKDDVVIASATRTPVGAFNGAFASVPAPELRKPVIKGALDRAGVEASRVSEVIMGQILTAGQAHNPVRRASIAAGSTGRNDGLRYQPAVRLGPALRCPGLSGHRPSTPRSQSPRTVSMSVAPHCAHLSGVKMGNFEMIDTMIKDGTGDAFNAYHMGSTAENVARQWQITRQLRDEFAVSSQNKAGGAVHCRRNGHRHVRRKIKTMTTIIEGRL